MVSKYQTIAPGKTVLVWLGFIASIAVLLVVSRWKLWVSMVAAALVLAAFTLSVGATADSLYATLTDPGVILLALVVGERLRRPYRMSDDEAIWDEEAAYEEMEEVRTTGKWWRRYF